MALTQQQALDEAQRLISRERAEELIRLKHWQHGSSLSVGTRPDIADATEEEDQALKALLQTLSGNNAWMDALYLVRNEHLECSHAAAHNSSVSSDDPEAVKKLRAKLQTLEKSQERMKAVNAAWRKAEKPAPDNQGGWATVHELLGNTFTHEELQKIRLDFARLISWQTASAPFPPYSLSNNSTEIRRIKQRIDKLMA